MSFFSFSIVVGWVVLPLLLTATALRSAGHLENVQPRTAAD